MTAAIAPADASALYLAATLFDEVSALTSTPTDGVYADCLVSMAFGHLVVGLKSEPVTDSELLRAVADAVAGCTWLSDAVRLHVARVLRDAADGHVSPAVTLQIALGASNRTTHAMVIDLMRAIGSDGLGGVADAIDAIAAAQRAH